jgi:hypothetical protein
MSQSSVQKCKHGYTAYHETVVDGDERTACCGAFYSWYGDGSGAYCKCCYGPVTGGDDVIGIAVDLSELDEM